MQFKKNMTSAGSNIFRLRLN